MPSETFFRLPAEKQQRLLDAARLEFSRVSLAEASISNIIRTAEIPRGSFYQYFENKEDLYFYYFATIRQKMDVQLKAQLKASKGDILEGIREFFPVVLNSIAFGENADFLKLALINMNFQSSKKITAPFPAGPPRNHAKKQHPHRLHQELMEEMLTSGSLDSLKPSVRAYYGSFIKIVLHLFYQSLAEGFMEHQLDEDGAIDQLVTEFNEKIKWLKYGVAMYPNEEESE